MRTQGATLRKPGADVAWGFIPVVLGGLPPMFGGVHSRRERESGCRVHWVGGPRSSVGAQLACARSSGRDGNSERLGAVDHEGHEDHEETKDTAGPQEPPGTRSDGTKTATRRSVGVHPRRWWGSSPTWVGIHSSRWRRSIPARGSTVAGGNERPPHPRAMSRRLRHLHVLSAPCDGALRVPPGCPGSFGELA